MANWLWRWRARVLPPSDAVAETPPAPAVRNYSGEYRGLYKYLRDRYAHRLVLSFVEIEDLVGFALPGDARLHAEWWGGSATSPQTDQSDSWILASRTAKVNLMAQNVLFERRA
jgi:hypothetical protein